MTFTAPITALSRRSGNDAATSTSGTRAPRSASGKSSRVMIGSSLTTRPSARQIPALATPGGMMTPTYRSSPPRIATMRSSPVVGSRRIRVVMSTWSMSATAPMIASFAVAESRLALIALPNRASRPKSSARSWSAWRSRPSARAAATRSPTTIIVSRSPASSGASAGLSMLRTPSITPSTARGTETSLRTLALAVA